MVGWGGVMGAIASRDGKKYIFQRK